MKLIIILTGMLFCATLTAQTNYYTSTKTFNENGYTYQCDVAPSKTITLYNKSNKWTYTNQIYKGTGKVFVMPDSGIDLLVDDTWTDSKCHFIVNSALSFSEKQRMKGHELITTIYISPETGKIAEVNFVFSVFNPFATIPVSVYRNIEMELKKNIWFTPTREGKRLNYILQWWGQEPQ